MPLLAFHNTAPGIFSGMNNYSPDRLKVLLQLLRYNNYEFISLPDYMISSEKDGQICLTFDDGYESFYNYAFPILREMSIEAAVFIPAGYIGKANDWDYSGFLTSSGHLSREQIGLLAKNGMTVASHGLTHSCLTQLTDRLLKIELAKSKEILEEIIGTKVRYLSYPFGRFDRKVESAAAETGYNCGLSLSFYRKSKSGFTLPRYAIYAYDTPYSVLNRLKSGILRPVERFKGAVMNAYAGGTIALNRIRRNRFPNK